MFTSWLKTQAITPATHYRVRNIARNTENRKTDISTEDLRFNRHKQIGSGRYPDTEGMFMESRWVKINIRIYSMESMYIIVLHCVDL